MQITVSSSSTLAPLLLLLLAPRGKVIFEVGAVGMPMMLKPCHC
jgi:hypothetical protein